jgi:hypothetical protein
VDGQSSIVDAPAVGHQREGQVTALGRSRMDLEALAAPCIPHGLSPVDLPAPAAVLALALRVPASVPVLALVRPAPVSAAQVA